MLTNSLMLKVQLKDSGTETVPTLDSCPILLKKRNFKMVNIKKLVVVMATVVFSFASSQVTAASYAKKLTTSGDTDANCAYIWYRSYHNHYSPNRSGLTSDRTYEYHITTETWYGSKDYQGACEYKRYVMEGLAHDARLVAGPGGHRGGPLVEIMRTVDKHHGSTHRKRYVGRNHANAGPAVCSSSTHRMKVKGHWYTRYWKVGSDTSAC